MKFKVTISRRKFIHKTAAALSFVYLPGIGRVQAQPYPESIGGDYQGRLCYNENPLGPSPKALAAIQDAVSLSHRYPDWYSSNLENKIAQFHGLSPSQICVGAGATEVLRLIADAVLAPGDEMITATPTYFQMAAETTANGATVVHVPVDENYVIDLPSILQAVSLKTKLISLVNPNNPLGTIVNKTDMENLIHSVPKGIVVVVDEAYHEYVHNLNYESCMRFAKEGLPIIVVRTFSKVYGLAGTRIGYAVASPQHTGLIASSQMFGTVSRHAQAAAEAALEDQDHINHTITLNDHAKQYLEKGLSDRGIDVIKSETNFMMFDTGTEAIAVAAKLASNGYQVRTGWGMPQHIRVSTGTMEEMEGFLKALDNILTSGISENISYPKTFALNSVYPNPFNFQCKIKISTFGTEKVQLTIYDTFGRKVRSLINNNLPPGVNHILWDGKNASGQRVASGIYMINLIQGEFATSAKVTLVK